VRRDCYGKNRSYPKPFCPLLHFYRRLTSLPVPHSYHPDDDIGYFAEAHPVAVEDEMVVGQIIPLPVVVRFT